MIITETLNMLRMNVKMCFLLRIISYFSLFNSSSGFELSFFIALSLLAYKDLKKHFKHKLCFKHINASIKYILFHKFLCHINPIKALPK